jgi:uncharacterized repeat protein (TIGR02543 family)
MKKFVISLTAIIIVAAVGFGLVRTAAAAADYQPGQNGVAATITAITNASGVPYSGTNPLPQSISTARIKIAGSVADATALQAGDRIVLQLVEPNAATTASYLFTVSLNADILDASGTKQFTATRTGGQSSITNTNSYQIVLTKTDAPAIGQLDFNLDIVARFATRWYDGNNMILGIAGGNQVDLPVSIPAQNISNGVGLSIGGSSSVGQQEWSCSPYFFTLYNNLLRGEALMSVPAGDYVVITRATVINGSSIVRTDGNPTAVFYVRELMPNGLSLSDQTANYQNSTGISNGSGNASYQWPLVNLPPDATNTQIMALLTPGTIGRQVKNSDGSYTMAINYGPIIGGETYPRGLLGSDTRYLNPTNNAWATNVALIEQARSLGLLPENMYLGVTATFADPSVATKLQMTCEAPLLSQSNTTTTTTPVVSNSSEVGQSSVKVHYISTKGTDLRQVSTAVGWPAGSATPSAPYAATVVNIAGYNLVKDAGTAQIALAANGVTSILAGDILTGASAVDWPLANTVRNVYYVYEPIIYTVDFVSNGGSNTDDQHVSYANYATSPTPPTRSHFTFINWYIDDEFKTVYDFATTPVTANTTLYAKWIEDERCQWDNELYADDAACVEPPIVTEPTTPIVPDTPNSGVNALSGATWYNIWYGERTCCAVAGTPAAANFGRGGWPAGGHEIAAADCRET